MKNNADSALCYYGFTVDGYCFDSDGTQSSSCHDLGLEDILSDYWGFTDEDLGIFIHDDPTTKWKVYEAICHLAYNTAPYTFDMLN
jgi:hypothetical protein